jgi:hypothetical protein
MDIPQPTSATIVKVSETNPRFVSVHSSSDAVLVYAVAQPFWYTRSRFPAATHFNGILSPLYNADEVIAWLEALTEENIPSTTIDLPESSQSTAVTITNYVDSGLFEDDDEDALDDDDYEDDDGEDDMETVLEPVR